MSFHGFHYLLCSSFTPLGGEYQVMYARTDLHAMRLGNTRLSAVDVVSRGVVRATGTDVKRFFVARAITLPTERVDHQRDALTGTESGQVKIVEIAGKRQLKGLGDRPDLVVYRTKNEVGESVARRRALGQAPVRR